jgi:activator of 2-hydroxyglutaryl-CoA dehydratase
VYALGIDVGSLNVKAVVLNGSGLIVSTTLPAGEGAEAIAKTAVEEVIRKSGLGQEGGYIVATGIGGKSITFSQQQKAITTCLARGVHHILPASRMIIDLGAETSTVLKINDRGRVTDWAGQDKCAAGTGMFLQAMAKVMQVKLDEMAEYSLRARARYLLNPR